MPSKLCCIFNTPSLYRELIYTKIDKAYDCDWFFEDADFKLKEFETEKLKHVKRLKTFKIGPFYGVNKLISLIRNPQYTHYIMLGHTRNISGLAFLFLKRFFYRNKKIFLWTHGIYGNENFLERVWKHLLYQWSDGLLIYGDYACSLMQKIGYDEKKLFPIHNSLNYDKQIVLRNKLQPNGIYNRHFGNNYPTLIFIGRLQSGKRLDMLLRAVADLKNSGMNFNVVFVGDGDEHDSLEKLAVSLGISDNVWFYGACYDEETNGILVYNADLCVAPGNIGLTAMHSLIFGCPAISHNDFSHQMPEFEAIKQGRTGAFFEHGSQKSLELTISNWFKHPGYNRNEIRANCFEEIDKNWNPEYQMRILNSILK